MDLKRILTAVLGLPAVVLIFIFCDKYIIDTMLMIIAIICMYEYFGVIEKVSHPIKWIGYVSTIIIGISSLVSLDVLMKILVFGVPIIMLILFLKVIITEMKTTFKDVAYTLLGIFYVVLFVLFLALIRGLENGKILIGYALVIAWSTDIFAYLIGKNFGKHKFSKISPKKSVEGCIAGVIGAITMAILYTLLINSALSMNYSYVFIAIASSILSILSQIGDFVASSIKRFADVKDYGNLLPGHGGMLDRIDSLIFLAPFAYMFFTMI